MDEEEKKTAATHNHVSDRLADVAAIIAENTRRNAAMHSPFDPMTGEGAVGRRVRVEIDGLLPSVAWLPETMMHIPLVRRLMSAGSVAAFLGCDDSDAARTEVIRLFIRLRARYDFCFWAYTFVTIKDKEGGEIPFRLNRPQRRLVSVLETMRLAGKPIRIVLLKARQWGGSTAIQLYMAWLQLMHKRGLNSLIVAHEKTASAEVKGMFDLMIEHYPAEMLHAPGETFNPREPKIEGVAGTQNIQSIPSRGCKIKLGTAERPDSARGGDSALVHCTEVAFWKKTDGKNPQQIVRSATSGVAYKPLTVIAYESTANGTGNYFHTAYLGAKEGRTTFTALFIPWFYIERYAIPLPDIEAFARQLIDMRQQRETTDERTEPGSYYWWLWEQGATLEAINWYMTMRGDYTDHADIAAEYPSDDIEAFAHSGRKVFDRYKVETLRKSCRAPLHIGEVIGRAATGAEALANLHFTDDSLGQLKVWAKPEETDGYTVIDRYLAVVDIGGRTSHADWSVIVVIDRYWMIEGGKPSVAAQWRGHLDHDLLAWKAAQIAAWYHNALLVIEKNTLDGEKDDHSSTVLDRIAATYPNLYALRQSPEEIVAGAPRKWGFHTNRSTKPVIIDTLINAVRDALWVERDSDALDEMLTYERRDDGSYGAIDGRHDDILMTRAIGLHVCLNEMDIPRIIETKGKHQPSGKRIISEATI